MTDLRKTAEIALRQLQKDDVYLGHRSKTRADAIEALRQALAEPVMYIDGKRLAQGMPDWKPGMVFKKPKREWVGLTEDEFEKILETHNEATTFSVYLSIEAKLKEKNG